MKRNFNDAYDKFQDEEEKVVEELLEKIVRQPKRIYTHKRLNGGFISLYWSDIGKIFENLILNKLIQNYEKVE